MDNTYSLIKVTRDLKIKYKSLLKGRETHIISLSKMHSNLKIKIQPGMGLPRAPGELDLLDWEEGEAEMRDPRGRKVSPWRRWRRGEGSERWQRKGISGFETWKRKEILKETRDP